MPNDFQNELTPEGEKMLLAKLAKQVNRRNPGIFTLSDRVILQYLLQILDGRDIQLGTGTGTRIGTASGQKLGFYGATAVIQAGAITAPSGGATVDSQARTAIVSLINALHNLGLTA